jgi:hypothetical protein
MSGTVLKATTANPSNPTGPVLTQGSMAIHPTAVAADSHIASTIVAPSTAFLGTPYRIPSPTATAPPPVNNVPAPDTSFFPSPTPSNEPSSTPAGTTTSDTATDPDAALLEALLGSGGLGTTPPEQAVVGLPVQQNVPTPGTSSAGPKMLLAIGVGVGIYYAYKHHWFEKLKKEL